MKILIRKAKPSDVSDIYALGMATRELWVSFKTKFYSEKELKGWIKKPNGNIFLVAIFGDKIVGFSFTKIMSVEWAMGDTMAIHSHYRGQGIGTLLHEKRKKILKKMGVNLLTGLVGTNHIQTRKFWRKKGYKEGKKLYWMEQEI